MAAESGIVDAKGVLSLQNVSLHETALVASTAQFDQDGFARFNLQVEEGRISKIDPVGSSARPADTDLGGRVILPAFVDCHTHLDKGHIWPRRRNPDGSFEGALENVGADRTLNWSSRDVATRMEFSLKCAYAHGTSAIRTHLDSIAPQETISWPVFEQKRDEWQGRIALQAASLVGIESVRDVAWFRTLATRVRDAGGVLGAVTYMVPDLDELLDVIFSTAIDLDLELDFHADETQDCEAKSLRAIANAARRHRYEKRILIGHCCSLARQPEREILETLDVVATASISIVSLPMCNLYLQDRRADGTTPLYRGVTLLHEMAARGINVAVASDNTRDPFYAYGDLDMLEVYRMATRIAHFDHPVGNWPATVGVNAAVAMGLDARFGRLRVGDPADFVLFEGRKWTELLSRPESNRMVVRGGQIVDAVLPAYSELDHLMELE